MGGGGGGRFQQHALIPSPYRPTSLPDSFSTSDSHVPQSHFTEQHESNVGSPGGAAIVCTLADHVGKVHTLSKHVARHRGLRGSNTQTLHKYKGFANSNT